MKKNIILIFIFVILLTGCNDNKKSEEKKVVDDTTYYKDGSVIYFNPETNKKCDSSEVESTGNSGCLRWYAINDEETGKKELTMILDHNTSLKSVYTGSEELDRVSASSVNKQLKLDTKKWNKNLNARVITIEDIEKILDIKFEQKSLYLETKNQTKPTSYENYNWLYNNTKGCTSYKCEKEDTETLGYWTSNTKMNNEQATIYAWVIKYDGSLVYEKKFLASRYGIRPVIDVSKNIIK